MARPKLPGAQRKVLTMAVRMRQDLDEGLAAVALLRGTTRADVCVNTQRNRPGLSESMINLASMQRSKKPSVEEGRNGRRRPLGRDSRVPQIHLTIRESTLSSGDWPGLSAPKRVPMIARVGLCLTARVIMLASAIRPSSHSERKPLVAVQKLTRRKSG